MKSVFFAAHLKALSILTDSDRVLSFISMNGRPEATDGDESLVLS